MQRGIRADQVGPEGLPKSAKRLMAARPSGVNRDRQSALNFDSLRRHAGSQAYPRPATTAIEAGHEQRQKSKHPQRHPLRQAAARPSRPEGRRRAAPSGRASRCRPARTPPTGWCGSTACTRCAPRSTIRAARSRKMLVTRNAAERLEIADLAALPFKAELVEPRDIDKITGSRRRASGRADRGASR